MLIKQIMTIALLSILFYNTQAQVIKNEFIVTLNDKHNTQSFFESIQDNRSLSNLNYRILSKDMGVVMISSNNHSELTRLLDSNEYIDHWSNNYKVEKRKSPNDTYFDKQWGLEMIDVKDVWEITTGGHDFYDREIVVAVLDEGYEFTHEELDDVFLINENEIPDDGIDNDENGYVDDYMGWNSKTQTDVHPLTDNHGLAVSGIIGAKADNSEGIAGINWNIKILPLSGIGTQAEVIAAYQYALNMRKRFNETNGAEGAYIVAVNYSAGIDKQFGTNPQFKTWCDMYDMMAEVGILSTGATTNANVNVDEYGDMPTTCPSEYLISVTNVQSNDTKVQSAGYGAVNIDIGAPGKGTLALDLNGGYDQRFGGTSAASPHVAGAIALLYSVPCQELADLALQNPKEAVTIVRNAIYEGVTPNITLEGITTSGGRLNIFNAMEVLQRTCSDLLLPAPKGALEIGKIREVNGNSNLEISYITPDNSPYNLMITDRLGKVVKREEFIPPTFGRKVLNIDMSQFPTGIYFISIYNNANISTEKRFVRN